MLKYKTHTFASIADGVESTTDILGGVDGVTRRITMLTGDIDTDVYFRVYLDSDQIVDIEANMITTAAPLLPMDLPIKTGQVVKAGFYNNSGGAVTPDLTIGYEES